MIRWLTAGESHGKCLVGILEGLPAKLEITEEEIDRDLKRRQTGYGRGERMFIEKDHVQILSGVRYGRTLGSPLAMIIENKDWASWQDCMTISEIIEEKRSIPLTTPRPGHADFGGAMKYRHQDIRNVIERSSARETAMRVALGAVGRKFFQEFGIAVVSHVVQIGKVQTRKEISSSDSNKLNRIADQHPLRCLDEEAEKRMIACIDKARSTGDTLGGEFEVLITGLPVGLGSYVHADRRLDACLAKAIMSIPAIKAVGIGSGWNSGTELGSKFHDPIVLNPNGRITRSSNHAGGIEGGMSNGESIAIRAVMKPLSSLSQPLKTIDLKTGEAHLALQERSDTCAVPAASVVAEAVVILALLNPFLEKFGGDSMDELKDHFRFQPELPWG